MRVWAPLVLIALLAGCGGEKSQDEPAANGEPRFTRVSTSAGMTYTGLGRTFVTLDFDRDGDLDLAMSSSSSPVHLYRNTTDMTGTSWLQLSIDSRPHQCLAPGGVHTDVEVHAGGKVYRRHLDGGPTYLGQSERIVHFGLGALDGDIDDVVLRYADGSSQRLGSVSANQRIDLTARHPADANGDGAVDVNDVPAFVSAFLSQDPKADVNTVGAEYGSFDFDDISVFVDRYLAPCGR